MSLSQKKQTRKLIKFKKLIVIQIVVVIVLGVITNVCLCWLFAFIPISFFRYVDLPIGFTAIVKDDGKADVWMVGLGKYRGKYIHICI